MYFMSMLLFFFKFFKFIFWLRWVFVAMHCAFSSCGGVWALGTRASVVVARGLSSCGSRALEHRLSSCGART